MAGKPRTGVAVSEMVTARLTPGEREALGELIRLRAADMEANDMPGDASFAGWLRWIIRREAKAGGLVVESPHTAEPAPPKRGGMARTTASVGTARTTASPGMARTNASPGNARRVK